MNVKISIPKDVFELLRVVFCNHDKEKVEQYILNLIFNEISFRHYTKTKDVEMLEEIMKQYDIKKW